MSLTAVRQYFRDRMESLGYEEWTDGFEFENIPETIMDGTFHLTSGTISQNAQNQTAIDLVSPVTIRLFLKGFRDPASAIDESILKGEEIVCECVKAVNANNIPIKDVQFLNMEPQPKDESNDNIVVLFMQFEARVFLNPN